MGPIELPQFATRLAENPKDLAVRKRKLVNPPRLRIIGEQILRRPIRDANRPRRGLVRHFDRHVAKHRVTRLVVWNSKEDELLEISVSVEDLNAPVTAISNIYVPLSINSNVMGVAKLTGVFIRVALPLYRGNPTA